MEDANKHFFRQHNNNGAVLNADTRGYQEYRKARAAALKQKEEFEQMKSDINDIKQMINQLLEKNK